MRVVVDCSNKLCRHDPMLALQSAQRTPKLCSTVPCLGWADGGSFSCRSPPQSTPDIPQNVPKSILSAFVCGAAALWKRPGKIRFYSARGQRRRTILCVSLICRIAPQGAERRCGFAAAVLHPRAEGETVVKTRNLESSQAAVHVLRATTRG